MPHTSRWPWQDVILTPDLLRQPFCTSLDAITRAVLMRNECVFADCWNGFGSDDIFLFRSPRHARQMTKDWRPQKQKLCNGALPCLLGCRDWFRQEIPVTPHCKCKRMYTVRDVLMCLGSIGSRYDTRATEAGGRLVVDWRESALHGGQLTGHEARQGPRNGVRMAETCLLLPACHFVVCLLWQ